MKPINTSSKKPQIKSCFVSEKDLIHNHCKYCKKSLIDIRGLEENDVIELLNDEKEPCVISYEGQLEDKRSLRLKISDTIRRARNLYTGPRLLAYASFFVLMTVITSCQKQRVMGTYTSKKEKNQKDKKTERTLPGYYHMDNITNEKK